jgi:hypothetical protein
LTVEGNKPFGQVLAVLGISPPKFRGGQISDLRFAI